jgi:hypothetical protein
MVDERIAALESDIHRLFMTLSNTTSKVRCVKYHCRVWKYITDEGVFGNRMIHIVIPRWKRQEIVKGKEIGIGKMEEEWDQEGMKRMNWLVIPNPPPFLSI